MRPERHSIANTLSASAQAIVLSAEAFLPERPLAAVVITHPHPLHGGSMFTPVPSALFERASAMGLAAVRFDFRGVGASTGTHDSGVGERDDVRSVIAWLRDALSVGETNDVPVFLAGWSFGADVMLAVDDDVAGWFAVAPPLAVVDPADMVAAAALNPKRLMVPQHDQFCAPDRAREITSTWVATDIEVVDGADHFLGDSLGDVANAFEHFVSAFPGAIYLATISEANENSRTAR